MTETKEVCGRCGQVHLKCKAHNRKKPEGPCGQPAEPGQEVCRFHGAKAPQNLAAAQRRLLAAADPAAAELVRLMEKGTEGTRLAAARDLLDRVGLSGKMKFEGEVTHGFNDDAYESLLGRIAELAERRSASGDTSEPTP